MTLFSKIAFLLFAAICALVQGKRGRESSESISDNNECALELEAILHKPKTCAFKYLHGLEVQFRKGGGDYLLFTPQADTYIFTFENTFRILIHTADGFRVTTSYFPDGSKVLRQPGVYTDTAQSYLNYPGFVRQISDQKFYYTFALYSQEGQYIAVTFEMPLVDDPLVCN